MESTMTEIPVYESFEEIFQKQPSRETSVVAVVEEYLTPTKGLLEDDEVQTSATSSLSSTDTSFCASSHKKSGKSSIFSLLGFEKNPTIVDSQDACKAKSRNSGAADIRLSMLSNFSTAYNVVSISLAMDMMDQIYPASIRDKSLCSSSLIAGMIVGQLAGGALGDVLGRHKAMTFVMLLQVAAALASSLVWDVKGTNGTHNSPEEMGVGRMTLSNTTSSFNIYTVLAVWRFVLGLGCGGIYPLAATLTAESSSSEKDRGKLVALTFSMQGVGYLVVPVLAWVLVTLFGEGSDISWRLLLGFGCVPGIVLTMLRGLRKKKGQSRLTQHQGKENKKQTETTSPKQVMMMRAAPLSVLDAIRTEKDLLTKVLGTGGCWFLFDVLFYGNTLFQPVVLVSVFGAAETLQKTARDAVLIAAMALPGYFVSVICVGRQSPRFIQAQGFFLMAILYCILGVSFDRLAGERVTALITYGSTFFFSNFGPNTTTFMLPSMTFSQPCRATMNGVCAACGKLGALFGALVFVAISDRWGDSVVMLGCATISMLGVLLTVCCISPDVKMGRQTTQKWREGEPPQEESHLLTHKLHHEAEMKQVYRTIAI